MKRLPAAFYASPTGREPVREWLKGLDRADRIIGEDQGCGVLLADRHAALPRAGEGIWEVRSELTQGRIARVLFCAHDGRMVLLHVFIKKTQKTPASDLDLATKRQKEIA